MIRNIVIHVSSSHAKPHEVNWAVRESSWSPGARREVLLDDGSFPVPNGGVEAVLAAAVAEVLLGVRRRTGTISGEIEMSLDDECHCQSTAT